ncbi:MAG: hypothetical protein WAW20_18440 [Anaerolineae bacterium]
MPKSSVVRVLLGGALLLLVMLAIFAPAAAPVPTLRRSGDAEPDRNLELYLAERGSAQNGESESLMAIGDYWYHRVSYPTGQFNPAWVREAAAQDSQVERAVPAGEVIYGKAQTESPLTLNANRFTSLGPQPLQSNGCLSCYSYGLVAGRTNVMAIDPVSTNVAYLGADGGGVWKTTNCCSAATTWAPVTDDPLLATIAIGDIVIDPNNHNTVYAGTGDLRFGSFSFGSAVLLKSTDQGATWINQGADVFAPYYPQAAGVFPQYQAIGKVRVDPNNSNNVVVGTKTGLYLSYDAGANWTGPCTTNGFSTQRQDTTGLILRDIGTDTQIYAFIGARGFATTVQTNLHLNGANGVYRALLPASGCPSSWETLSRADNGWPADTATGIPVNTGTLTGNRLGRLDVAIAPSNSNVIYVQVQAILVTGGAQRGGQLGVWRTTDGGTTWSQRSSQTGLTGCYGDYGQNWYDQGVAVDPNNSDIVLMSTVDIFKSTNGGTTFTDKTCGYAGGTVVHVDHHALAYVPGSSTTLLAGSDGGAYVSTNGGESYTQINNSLSTLEFYSGDITKDFATAATPGINGGMQDNGSAVYVWAAGNPGPAVWQLRKGGDGMFARIEPMLGQRWYQESQNGALAVSTTGAYGSQSSATGGWSADTRRSFVFPYEIQKNGCPGTGCTHMIAGSYRVWETILGGIPTSSWVINSGDLTKNTLADRSFINQLNYAWSDATKAIVGTNDGNVQWGRNLGAGVANSAIWVNLTAGNAVLPNRPILDVALDPANPLIGYAAVGGFDQNTPTTPGHVFQVVCTADCASFTWANKSANLPNIPADSIIANPRFPQQVFVGTDWGLYYTNDINQVTPVWYRFQAGLPNAMIWDMTIDSGASTLALWTRSRGAYVWPLPAAPYRTCPDFNANGTVGVEDISAIAAHWGETSASPGWNNRYDRNGDDHIDIVDIMLVVVAFGSTC